MAVSITDIATPTAASQPYSIRHFADGSTVFTERAANKIGFLSADGKTVTLEVTVPTANSFPIDVTESGGFYWFTEFNANQIGRLTLDGKTFTEFPVPTANSAPAGITTASDGSVWFTENAGNKIARISSDGSITEYAVPTANSAPTSIVPGPNGNLYFTEYNGNKIGQILTQGGIFQGDISFSPGDISEFTIPTAGSNPFGIDIVPGGQGVFFAEQTGNKIGRLDLSTSAASPFTTGVFTEYTVPTAGSVPGGVVHGLDNNLYFTEQAGNKIGRIEPNGTVTEFAVPTAASHPSGITYLAGGTLFFAEQDTSKIGTVLLPGVLNISAPTTVIEGQDRFATFTVTRSEGTNGVVSVNYATTPGTAFSPEDFTSESGTVTFADGDNTPKTFTVPIISNGTLELLPNQTFTATLSAPTGQATLGTATALVGIIDSTPRALSISDVTVNENSGTATFTVSLNTPSGLPITVTAQTVAGTATSGADFTAVGPIVLNFATGVTTQTFTVPIINNGIPEPTETFSVVLSGATNATISKAQGIGTILDNDAPLIVSAVTITGVENQPLGNMIVTPPQTSTLLVATFSDPNGPTTLVSDYAATIEWGDNSASSGTITSGTGSVFFVTGSHVYAKEGTYTTLVTVFRNTLITPSTPPIVFLISAEAAGRGNGQAVISDAPLVSSFSAGNPLQPTNAPTSGVAFKNLQVATFTDEGGAETPGSYIATIDWGDGTPISPGSVFLDTTVTVPPANGTGPFGFLGVSGAHSYAIPGTYTVSVVLQSEGGSVATSSRTLTVAATPGFLSGFLNPASDSGVSNSDAITNVNRPVFSGFAPAGATVRYFAQAAGGTQFQIGQGAADASGFYSITALSPLADGSYTITADVSSLGVSATAIQVLPSGTTGSLVIDTVAPRVGSLGFNRLTGKVQLLFVDDRSGFDASTLGDGANYRLSSPHASSSATRVGSIAVGDVLATTNARAQIVTLTVNKGRKLPFGVYTLLARSGGIEDIAGNALDGEFYSKFPSGNGRPGGDFVVDFASFHNITRAPGSANGSANPTGVTATPAIKVTKHVTKVVAKHVAQVKVVHPKGVPFGKGK